MYADHAPLTAAQLRDMDPIRFDNITLKYSPKALILQCGFTVQWHVPRR